MVAGVLPDLEVTSPIGLAFQQHLDVIGIWWAIEIKVLVSVNILLNKNGIERFCIWSLEIRQLDITILFGIST